jgi:ESAT-6 family protein
VNGYRVDLQRLHDLVGRIARFDKHLESVLDDIDKQVDRLHVTWSGTAADEQRRAHEEWERGMREMREGLSRIQASAKTAHSNYSAAIQTNSTMWGQAR